jgi:uncharacterized protein YwgA
MPIRKPDNEARITNKEVYSKLGTLIDKHLDASDLILLVLLAAPVKGDINLQKQVFLAWKELYYEVSIEPGYQPWFYGPYSRIVADLLRSLKSKGLIDFKGRSGEGVVYTITDQGKKRIKDKIARLKISTINLQRSKERWDEWTSKGILRYVYRNYPEYAVKSLVSRYKW